MSLRVWLPLNGTLDNLGLDEVALTNNGATSDNNGKIGKCWLFDGTNDYITTIDSSYPEIFSGDFSICFWVYSSTDGSRDVYFGNYGISGSGNWFNIEKNTSNQLRFWWNNGSPNKYFTGFTILNSEGWVHVTLTRHENVIKVYKNSSLIEEYSATISNNIPSTATKFVIGGDSRTSGDLVFGGKLNDLRIYDHTLSEKEIHEISKALVMHYPLDNNGLGQENLILNSENLSCSKIGTTSNEYWACNVGQSYMNVPSGTRVTISLDLEMYIATTPVPRFTIYNSNNKGPKVIDTIDLSSQINALNPSVGDTVSLRIKGTTTIRDRSNATLENNYIEFYSLYDTGNRYDIKNIKLELGDKATPWSPASEDNSINFNYNILTGTGENSFLTSGGSSTNATVATGKFANLSRGNGTCSVTADATVPVGGYRWSITGNTSGNKDFAQYGLPLTAGKTYIASWYAKGSGTGMFRLWNSTNSAQILLEYKRLNSTWQRESVMFTASSSYTSKNCGCLFGISGSGNVDMCGFKLEEGSELTPWVLSENEYDTPPTLYKEREILDCSGFNNDGIANNVSIVTDTPRYNASSEFITENTSYVKVSDNKWMAQAAPEFTINLWAYKENWTSQTNARLFSCTESGGFNTEGGSSGYLRFSNHVYTDDALSSTKYKYNSKELNIAGLSSGWHMLTFIRNLNGNKVYVDGSLHSSYNFVNYGEHFNLNARLFLGCEANTANPSTPYITAKMSDFRFYYSELSAEDIKELYMVKASIDNLQNMHAYWYEEDTTGGSLISKISTVSANGTILGNDSVQWDFSNNRDTYFFFQTTMALDPSKTYYLSFDVEGMADDDVLKFGVPQNRTYGDFILRNGHNIGLITNCNIEANTNIAFDDYTRTSSSVVTLTGIRLFEQTNAPKIEKTGIIHSNSFSDGETHRVSIYKNGDISAKELIEI